jgi:ubiquinone/menaquinone biosynthesis C-methylase UbiE
MAETTTTERYTQYDSLYYEDGAQRGTVYRDYKLEARRNRTYFEVAESIVECFRPRRVLEVGCATGIVVKHLNDLGVEAHGIDVSTWAVENREHDSVVLSGAESMPFADDSFDIVFSVHSLEHLPSDVKDAAFAEMTRVCSSGIQFHMLPIIGSGPYVGDTFGHLVNLRSDPSHNLLFNKDWWLKEWAKQGWEDTGLQIAFLHDSEHFELTECQYVVSRKPVSEDLARRVLRHNVQIARGLNSALYGKPPPGLDVRINRLCDSIRGPANVSGNTSVTVQAAGQAGDFERRIRDLEQAATVAREEASHYREAYLDTINSTCWKATAPLRWLKRKVA